MDGWSVEADRQTNGHHSSRRPIHSSVHLAVRGLVNAGAAEQAQALAAAAEKTMALADSTKEILSQAKAAPAAAEETKEKGKEGEEGQAAAGAEEGAKK